jgi:3'(2'), 5'-bisphosphate nucleotidase
VAFSLTDDLIQDLVSLSEEAGGITLEYYRSDLDIREKRDSSPVTEADEKAEALIRSQLETLTPDIPFIGEESYAAGHHPDVSGGTFWLVDALDGTKEFVNKRDEFTVNIALIDNGVPVFGVVHAPAVGDTYWGYDSQAWKRTTGGSSSPIFVRQQPEDGIVVATSRSHRSGEEDFLSSYSITDTIIAGSSLKFCLIAEGKADLYPRLGPTSEWDIAAGHAVLVAAGGRVVQIDGAPLLYGKEDILNPHFLATGGY